MKHGPRLPISTNPLTRRVPLGYSWEMLMRFSKAGDRAVDGMKTRTVTLRGEVRDPKKEFATSKGIWSCCSWAPVSQSCRSIIRHCSVEVVVLAIANLLIFGFVVLAASRYQEAEQRGCLSCGRDVHKYGEWRLFREVSWPRRPFAQVECVGFREC